MIHNDSKVTVVRWQPKQFYGLGWGRYNMRNCIKGVEVLGRLRTTALAPPNIVMQ